MRHAGRSGDGPRNKSRATIPAHNPWRESQIGTAGITYRVLIGATPEGRKELVGFQAGVRESAQSWRELLACLRGRGLTIGPELAIGDGALGFWKALEEIFPDTRRQRCWVHKTANVLNKLPKSRQTAAKAALHDIWMADGRAEAERAMNTFAAKYDAKYPQAVACLTKDRDAWRMAAPRPRGR